ncbi:MAG: hypothetical protein QG602_573 [Verrucomicrobiota bacterium]|nr:hypothetical protein [Verrucomicrobiota bacterium]
MEAADRDRRQSHNVVIDAYNALTRYCRKFRKRDLSVETTFPPESPRARIGDLAAKIYSGVVQAEDLDEGLHRRLTR